MRDQTPKDIVFNSLLNWVKEGRFLVPDFQRAFEWKAGDIRDLTRSIFLEYYVGSLLLWKGKPENFDRLACEPLHGQARSNAEYIVLDGQQRLTAIGYAFLAPDIKLPTRAQRALYYVRVDEFLAGRFDDAFDYQFVKPGGGAGINGALRYFGSVEDQYERHTFPLAYASDLFALAEWTAGYAKHWEARAKAAEEDEERVLAERAQADALAFKEIAKGIISESKISYIELDKELDIARVCDIFTQINSKGVRLDVFDLMNALLKPKGVQLRTDLWAKARPKLDFVDTKKLNVYVLQVMSILRQSYSSPQYLYHLIPGVERKIRKPDGSFDKQIMVASSEEFVERWGTAVEALEHAIARLRHPQEFGVSNSNYLPYTSILPVFAAAVATAKSQPAELQLAADARLRLWYWASVFTNQYSASSETTAARDIQALRAWFIDETAEPPAVAEFRASVPTLDLRLQNRKGEAVYNGVFNLLVIAGAKDWVSGAVPMPEELNDHHIVPKSWGAQNLAPGAVDTILNRTPLTEHTNQQIIHDSLPNEYLPQMIATSTRAKVEAMMATHFVSPAALDILLRDPFLPSDFDDFVQERQKAIIGFIDARILDDRADLPPDLRALDEAVEHIELRLRALIATRLGDDISQLPPYVREKVDQKVEAELKRNPGGDSDRFKPLVKALEFADITELQRVIGAKGEARFKDVFPSAEDLDKRFGQLCGLRNPIRHSRTVTDVARHDGEAAIKWFNHAMAGIAT